MYINFFTVVFRTKMRRPNQIRIYYRARLSWMGWVRIAYCQPPAKTLIIKYSTRVRQLFSDAFLEPVLTPLSFFEKEGGDGHGVGRRSTAGSQRGHPRPSSGLARGPFTFLSFPFLPFPSLFVTLFLRGIFSNN